MDYPQDPSVGLVGGKFVDENAATAQIGSIIPASWGNGVTDELRNIIVAASLVPAEATHTQVLAALQLLFKPGRLLRTSVYTLGVANALMVSINGAAPVAASSTFAPLAITAAVKVKAQGGGGGGGGAQSNTSATISTGNGGAAGGYSESWFTSAFSGVAVTVGLGGVGVLSATAGTGGTTSFGSLLSVPGGNGGGSGAQVAPPTSGSNISGGTQGPLPTGGNLINVRGGFGWFSILASTPVSGAGGRSYFGDGGIYVSATAGGTPGAAAGSGGGGGCSGFSGPNAGGGSGAAGILIVEEYA